MMKKNANRKKIYYNIKNGVKKKKAKVKRRIKN